MTRHQARLNGVASGEPKYCDPWPSSKSRLLLMTPLCVGALTCAGPGRAANDVTRTCASILTMHGTAQTDPGLKIVEARLRPAGDVPTDFPLGGKTPVPAHCEVIGAMHERVGANGQHYAIKFHMRLPLDWNGRFIFQGGGGSNGNLGSATAPIGANQRSGLMRGYAVVSQDSGHDNAVNNDPARQGIDTFGYDAEARRDYGYASHPLVARTAKLVIKAAYGRLPAYSYFVGCSKGGQEGMMMAQRYPTYFDGILAAAPGFTLPKAGTIEPIWDVRAFAKVATSFGAFDAQGAPLLNKAFSNEDLAIASKAILDACDGLDGVVDGMVQAFSRCTTSLVTKTLAEVTCASVKTEACLAPVQVAALKIVFGGAHNSKGEALYADRPWDAGIGGKDAGGQYMTGWHDWKMGRYASPTNSAIDLTLAVAASTTLGATPPKPTSLDPSALVRGATAFDFDKDAAEIFLSNQEFPESEWDMDSADSMDRTQFRDQGGKLIIVQGVSDPIFSINDTVRWLTSLDRVEGGTASDFVRLFPVPGMNHCGGGPATGEYDAFQPLVDWVEKHRAPDAILATAGPGTPWPGRTRPLCPYPLVTTYRRSGDVEKAENFSCM